MSEWLTTGQVIDRLRIGEEAFNQDGYGIKYGHKGDLLYFEKGKEPNSEDKFAAYYPFVRNDKWRINYLFVSFDEAQKAHAEEGKTIIYWHSEEQKYRFVYGEYGQFKQLADDGIELHELVEGEWTIEQ